MNSRRVGASSRRKTAIWYRTAAVAPLFIAAACVRPVASSPPSTPVATPSRAPSQTPTPTPEPAVFSAKSALATVRALAKLGPREAAGDAYRRAAGRIEAQFTAIGYEVRTQRVRVNAGTVDGIKVPSGVTLNVIAEPPGFDATRPWIVLGGHLDTVPDSPGANDNASGMGVILELARMARMEPPKAQVVFVAFGAEERRRQTASRSQVAIGSRAYVRSLSSTERAGLRAMLDVDMVGAGRSVRLIGDRRLGRRALNFAHDLKIAAQRSSSHLPSDHLPFDQMGVPSLWFYAGPHPTWHARADTVRIVQAAALARTGRLAWALIRTLG